MRIIFYCVASPDYVIKYQKCIRSQNTYCQKNNYDYFLDEEISDDYYWKKICNIQQFYHTHDLVVIIDADCEITINCPPIESFLNECSIYYVLGISGRPNSGFLPVKTNSRGQEFINNVIAKRDQVCPDDLIMKGENGRIIWELQENNKLTQELSKQWNCSNPKYINSAYIIHYTNLMKDKFK